MVKTNRLTLHMLYNIQQSVMQDSDYVAIVPMLPRRTATNDTTVTQDSHKNQV